MTKPNWDASVYGNVVFMIDEARQVLSLSSERKASEGLKTPVKGEWNNSNIETLIKVIQFYEAQGYTVDRRAMYEPEGTDRAACTPVIRANFSNPCIYWQKSGAAKPVTLSAADIARILGENPGKAKPKKK